MPVLDKWSIYDSPHVKWEPNAGQLLIAEDNSRHQVVAAGRRFGKSYLGAMKLLPEIFYTKPLAQSLVAQGKRREFWILGPEYSDSEKEFRVLWNLCKRLQLPMEKGSFNNPEVGNMSIVLWDGTFICTAKSARYPERLVGEGLSGVILAEAAKLKSTIWPKYIRPTLSDFEGWSFHSSTPEGKNWFYTLYEKAKDPHNKSWNAWRMPAWVNQYVYRQETKTEDVYRLIDLARHSHESIFQLVEKHKIVIDGEILDNLNDLTYEAFLQEIGADFSEHVGRVFKEFEEETHVGDLEYNPVWKTYAAVDYGYTNPNVWLLIQVGPWGEINVLDEIYESGLDSTDFADEILRRNMAPRNLLCFFPDPADPNATRILEKRLRVKARPNTGGELNSRLMHIRKALQGSRTVVDEWWMPNGEPPPESHRPRMMFDRKCKQTIKDMLNYRYPELKKEVIETSEKPLKKDDHGPEALGRFFAGMFGTFGRSRNAKVYQATFRDDSTYKTQVTPAEFKDALANWR